MMNTDQVPDRVKSTPFIGYTINSLAAMSLFLLPALNNYAFACFSNVAADLVYTQFGATLKNNTGTCTFTPPASFYYIEGTGGGNADGTVTSDARTMTFDMDWTGGSSGTSFYGTAFIYIPDLIFTNINNPSATSASIGSNELYIDYTFTSSVVDPVDGLANGSRSAYFSDLSGSKFFETAVTGFQFGTGTQNFSDAMNPIYNNPESLPLNTPIGLYVQFGADLASGGSTPTSTDALVTLGGSPLFVLPAGLTVNSESLGLVNNAFVVPIPAALWLFGSGLLGLVGISRCRKGTLPA